ncbi:hypothetical protein [Pseudomonas sp. I2]|uniref:hypothetical protein n=1 Tax=Pseudomonas sp. I2 TaxID=1338438 RepID=UPI0034D6A81A
MNAERFDGMDAPWINKLNSDAAWDGVQVIGPSFRLSRESVAPDDLGTAAMGVLADVFGHAVDQGNRFVFAVGGCQRQAGHADQLQRHVRDVIHVSGLAGVDVGLNQLVAHAFSDFWGNHLG